MNELRTHWLIKHEPIALILPDLRFTLRL